MYFTFMEEAFIFVQLHVAVHHPFVSAKRTPFSISCRIGLVARSLSFCSSEKVFISSSFWRIVLPDTASLNRFFFPSAFLIYYPTAFWHVRFLLIKTTENLIEDHLYIYLFDSAVPKSDLILWSHVMNLIGQSQTSSFGSRIGREHLISQNSPSQEG